MKNKKVLLGDFLFSFYLYQLEQFKINKNKNGAIK